MFKGWKVPLSTLRPADVLDPEPLTDVQPSPKPTRKSRLKPRRLGGKSNGSR